MSNNLPAFRNNPEEVYLAYYEERRYAHQKFIFLSILSVALLVGAVVAYYYIGLWILFPVGIALGMAFEAYQQRRVQLKAEYMVNMVYGLARRTVSDFNDFVAVRGPDQINIQGTHGNVPLSQGGDISVEGAISGANNQQVGSLVGEVISRMTPEEYDRFLVQYGLKGVPTQAMKTRKPPEILGGDEF